VVLHESGGRSFGTSRSGFDLVYGMAESLQHSQLLDAVNPAWLSQQKAWIKETTALFERGDLQVFTLCYDQAVAQAALNPDAYLFTRKDQDWLPHSIWATHEYWALTQNVNIQRIWRVDPWPVEYGGDGCNEKVLLWSRERDRVWKVDGYCPVVEI
jgi:hypothetical protein